MSISITVKNDIVLISLMLVICTIFSLVVPVTASGTCASPYGVFTGNTTGDSPDGTHMMTSWQIWTSGCSAMVLNGTYSQSLAGYNGYKMRWLGAVLVPPPPHDNIDNWYTISNSLPTPTPTPSPTPVPSGACICSGGYCYSQGNYLSYLGTSAYVNSELLLAGSGSYTSSPFFWLASTFFPCSNATAANSTNATPTPYPTHTYPTSSPTAYPTVPGPGQPSSIPVVPSFTPGMTISSPISITNVTLPSNISIPVLPSTLPGLPGALNTTNYRNYVNETPWFGSLFVSWLNYYDSLSTSVKNVIMLYLQIMVMPFSTITSQFTALTTDFNSILLSWTTSASLVTALMWYAFMSIPIKAMNVFFVVIAIDVIEQVLDWPTEL